MQPKKLAHLCCAILLFSWAGFCFGQQPTATLEIQMSRASYKVETPIRLDIVLANLSTETLHIDKASNRDGQAEAYLSVEVRDSGGKPLRRTDGQTIIKNGRQYTIPKRWLTRKGVPLEPNQKLRDFLLLSGLFDLSTPGTYTVTTRAEIRSPYSGPEIKWIEAISNKTTFTVTQ